MTINDIAAKNSVARAIVRINKFTPKVNPEAKLKPETDIEKFSSGELKSLTSSWFGKNKKKSSKLSADQIANVITKKTVFKFDKAIWDQGIKDGVISKNKSYSNPDVATYMLLASGIKAEELKKGTKGKLWDSKILFNAVNQNNKKLKTWVDETAEAMKPKTTTSTKA